MPESDTHQDLVRALRTWVLTNHLKGDSGMLFADEPTAHTERRPPLIGGYVPDLYAVTREQRVVVGEAKTLYDLETDHSRAQLTAFLAFCSNTPGSLLVLAVPWHVCRRARNMLRTYQQRLLTSAGTVVLEQLTG